MRCGPCHARRSNASGSADGEAGDDPPRASGTDAAAGECGAGIGRHEADKDKADEGPIVHHSISWRELLAEALRETPIYSRSQGSPRQHGMAALMQASPRAMQA